MAARINQHKWTPDDDRIAREMIDAGKTYSQIGAVVGRTEGAVNARMQLLNEKRRDTADVLDDGWMASIREKSNRFGSSRPCS